MTGDALRSPVNGDKLGYAHTNLTSLEEEYICIR